MKIKEEGLTAREKEKAGDSLTFAEQRRLEQLQTYEATRKRINKRKNSKISRAKHILENFGREEQSPEEEAL